MNNLQRKIVYPMLLKMSIKLQNFINGITSFYNILHNFYTNVIMEFNLRTLLNSENDEDLLFMALEDRNLESLKVLLEAGLSVNCKSSFKNSLLHRAVLEYHVLSENNRAEMLEIGAFLIGQGCDLNSANDQGYTPLYLACLCGLSDWIHLLLFHGADASIPCDRGILPISAMNVFKYDQSAYEDLFRHTFDETEKVSVKLTTIVNSMEVSVYKINSYPNVIKKVAKIEYDRKDLHYFYMSIPTIIPECFKLFLNDFRYIVKDMIKYHDVLYFCLDIVLCKSDSDEDSNASDNSIDALFSNNVFDILEIIVKDEDLVFDLVENANPTLPTLHYIVHLFEYADKSLHELTKFVCILLTYGLPVTSIDIETVYLHYGFCELFKILLHMDIQFSDDCQARSLMLMLYFNVDLSLEDILRENRCHLYVFMDFKDVIDYFCNAEIKEICLSLCEEEDRERVEEKIGNMPKVPSLVELARNAARGHIVKKYRVKSMREYHKVLDDLAVGRWYKKILTYEVKLYNY